VIRKSIKRGLNLQTYTPVSTIERSGQRWTVHTSRGAIDTHKVIAATNAYTSGCLPEFTDRIVPIRGAACSIRPAASHSLGGSEGPLRFTYGIRYGQGDFDYMIPRQGRGPIPGQGDKGLILGGAKSMFLHDKYLWYNNVRDDQEMPGVRRYFEDYMGKHFAGWDGDAGNVEQVWSGGECRTEFHSC
jgi:glycine/D-amino acid oxidase-like deaminating enzyme